MIDASGLPPDLLADNLQALVAFAVAFGVTWFATPRLRASAIRIGLVDRPDGRLKNQREPVPYLGGLGVALGVLASLGIVYQFDHQLLAMLLGASIVLVLGLLDDVGSIGPWPKLIGQAIGALTLIKAGVRIELAFLPTWIELPLTVFWVLAVTNAVNLIDIMDGLASSIGALAALIFGAISYAEGHVSAAFLAAALAGSLLAFRRFNRHPATIYLGDTGSLFTGFVLAAIAMVNGYTRVNVAAFVVPLLILAFPLLDVTFVIGARLARRIPVMRGSPDHLALRLRKRFGGTPAAVNASTAIAVVFGGAGVAMMQLALVPALVVLGAAALLGLAFFAWMRHVGRP